MLTREDLIQRATFHRLMSDLLQEHEVIEGRAIIVPLKASRLEHEAKATAYRLMAHDLGKKG